MRKPEDRPNVILVNCDDLGYGDLGCYGSGMCLTPALDRMANEGTRFTSFYQASPLCSPSRGAMLTGCYPRRIGFDRFEGQGVLFPGQGIGLNPGEQTFAALLKGAGYATQMIGKWHCGDQSEFLPTRHGFDHYYGLPYSNDMGRQGPQPKHPPLPLLGDEEVLEQQPDQTSITERYLERARRFMRANRGGPFLLYFAHMYVHLPIYVPERFLREAARRVPDAASTQLTGDPTSVDRRVRYVAAVSCIDWVMDVLIKELESLGLSENTILLFTSDNGSRCDVGPSNGPLKGIKSQTWEGGMRLPLVVRWPGRVPQGRVCDELVAGMDILPSLARLAGAAVPGERRLDGVDISTLLLGTTDRSPRETLFYYFGDRLDAVRDRTHKLFVGHHSIYENVSDVIELYDLSNDPGETTDISHAHPEIVSRLMKEIEGCREDLGDATTGHAGANIRPPGKVANPVPLTSFDPEHPYYIAAYDLDEKG